MSSGNADDCVIRILDTNGESRDRIFARTHGTGIALSPDGQMLVSALDKTSVAVWRLADGSQLKKFDLSGVPKVIDWSKDGRWVAIGFDDGNASLWDAQTWEQVSVLLQHPHTIDRVLFSPRGDALWVVSGNTSGEPISREYDLTEFPLKPPVEIKNSAVADYSPDGEHIIAKQWGTLQLGKAKSHEWAWGETVSTASLGSVVFSSGGTRIARGGRGDRYAEVWDVENKRLLRRVAHRQSVRPVAFDPQCRYWISGSDDGTICMWDYNVSGSDAAWSHDPPVGRMMLTDSEEVFVGGAFPIVVRNMRSNVAGEAAPVERFYESSADGQVLLAIIPTPTDSETNRADPSPLPIDGPVPETIQVWDRQSSRPRLQFRLPDAKERAWRAITISSSGRLLATRQWESPIRIWDILHEQPIEIGSIDNFNCLNLKFSSDERWLAACGDHNKVKIWEVQNQSLVAEFSLLEVASQWAISVAFASDDRRVAVGTGNGQVGIWDIETKTKINHLNGHTGEIHSMAFFPDHQRLAVAGVGPIVIWDIETGQELISLPVPDYKTEQVSVSRDGNRVYSRSDDGIIRWW